MSSVKADTETSLKTEKSDVQNVIKKVDSTAATENKSLTFKDWKSLKASQNNEDEKSKTSKINIKLNNKGSFNTNNGFSNNAGGFNRGLNSRGPQNFFGFNNGDCDSINNKGSFNTNNGFSNNAGGFNRGQNSRGPPNFFGGNNGNCGIPPFMSLPNFNNNFMMGLNLNGYRGNNFNNNFNNSNCGRNVNNNNFNSHNISNDFKGNNFPTCFNSNNSNGPNLPDSFFASDGIYRQKDMMQRPLSPSANPFRDDRKANELLQKLHNKEFQKPLKNNRSGDIQKGRGGNKQGGKKSNLSKPPASTQNVPKINTEPTIFVPNPQGNSGVAPYIPKPRLPNENPDMTFEERKKAWKEYREAMKPFKNREFYNARRVVQRLGKKDPKELEERDILRLTNAREIMASHKERLSAKYGNYTKAEDSSTELGELYVLKKKPLNDWDHGPRPRQEKQFQNYGNFGENQKNNEFGPGRKIVGGYSGFKGFVSGGILESNGQQRF